MSSQDVPGLARRLRTLNLTLFGLVAIAPVAAITMHGFVFEASEGAVLPSYFVAAAGVCFSALSFAAMAEAAPSAGSVHGYVGRALGPAAGFLGGWAILLDYLLLNSLVIIFGAIYLAGAFPAVSVQPMAIAFAIYALVLAVLGISWSARADMLMTGLQALLVVTVIIAGAVLLFGADPATGPVSAPIWPEGVVLGSVIGGASVAIIAYLGFDTISTLAEEVSSPDVGRVIGRATLISVGVMTAVFLLAGWVLNGLATTLTGLDPSEAGLQIVASHMPGLVLPLGVVIGLALGLGVNLVVVNGAARIIFAMARAGQLPSPLARIHPRFRSPWIAVTLVSVVNASLSLVALSYVDTLAALVSFGALTGFLLVNISVIAHYGIAERSRRWLRHWLLPAAGAAVVLYIMSGISRLALMLGVGWLVAGLVIWGISAVRKPVSG